jgi:two-component system LytT family sensor kinase
LTGVTLTGDQFILFVLLFRVGIMAVVASALITSSFFKRLIFLETRNPVQNWQIAVTFGSLVAAGSAVRILVGYEGMDLSLSGTFLMGLMSGLLPGASVGFVVGIPGFLRGELLTLPFTILCGVIGGLVRERRRSDGDIWEFSPIFFNDVIRSARVAIKDKRLDSRALIFLSVLSLEALRTLVALRFKRKIIFAFLPENLWVLLFVWISTLACVGILIKIWNNTRVEILLEEQKANAVQARFDALRSQINPHFFFNTLNTATSCIWTDKNKARRILVKLSSMLRRLFRDTGAFVPLSSEIEFIDDYLSLEKARFGEEKIRVDFNIDPKALDVPVPSMLLQPIIENAIKHGISPKVGGGTIEVEGVMSDGGNLNITISDDGKGFKGDNESRGLGLINVRERLNVAYGTMARMDIESTPGEGTRVRISLPVEREKE